MVPLTFLRPPAPNLLSNLLTTYALVMILTRLWAADTLLLRSWLATGKAVPHFRFRMLSFQGIPFSPFPLHAEMNII